MSPDQDQLRYWFNGWDHYAQELLFDFHGVSWEERWRGPSGLS